MSKERKTPALPPCRPCQTGCMGLTCLFVFSLSLRMLFATLMTPYLAFSIKGKNIFCSTLE